MPSIRTIFAAQWPDRDEINRLSIRERLLQHWLGVNESFGQRALAVRINGNANQSVSLDSERDDSTICPSHASIDPLEFQRFLEHATQLGCGEPQSLRPWLDLAEAWQITRALRLCRGNRSAAARTLGIGRRTLYAKMEKLSITASWGV